MSIQDAGRAFSNIYDKNVWGKGSGVGSEPEYTKPYVAMLQAFLQRERIRSVVDVGCGDWQFSQLIDWTGIEYQGFDVVAPVVEDNIRRFGAPNIRFVQIRDGVLLPKADLVICKDVLQHLPTFDVLAYLRTFRRLYRYLLITNDIAPGAGFNADISYGEWRAIKLGKPPFNQKFEEVLRWNVDAYGCSWTKQSCLIRNDPDPDVESVALSDRDNALRALFRKVWRSTKRRAKMIILKTPILGRFARTARRFQLSIRRPVGSDSNR